MPKGIPDPDLSHLNYLVVVEDTNSRVTAEHFELILEAIGEAPGEQHYFFMPDQSFSKLEREGLLTILASLDIQGSVDLVWHYWTHGANSSSFERYKLVIGERQVSIHRRLTFITDHMTSKLKYSMQHEPDQAFVAYCREFLGITIPTPTSQPYSLESVLAADGPTTWVNPSNAPAGILLVSVKEDVIHRTFYPVAGSNR